MSNWEVVPHTKERVLVHKETGQVIEFTDDPEDTHQELPIIDLLELAGGKLE